MRIYEDERWSRGIKLCRDSWPPHKYIKFSDTLNFYTASGRIYNLDILELLADDWKVYEERVPELD